MIQYNDNIKEKVNYKNNQFKASDGVLYYLDRITATKRNTLGLYDVADVPNPTIPNHQEVEIQAGELIANEWVEAKTLVDLSIEVLRTKLKAQLKAKSKEVEEGGFLASDGTGVDTSERGQTRLNNGAYFSDKKADKEYSFMTKQGTWKKVSTAVLHAVHIEVGDFISGVRDTHMEQDILLDNANEATLQGYNVEAIVWQL